MNRAVGIALLVIGVILLMVGFNEANSFRSEVNEFFTNNPSDRAIWMFIGGGVAAAVGLYFLFARAPSR